jgi:hypothetical protein
VARASSACSRQSMLSHQKKFARYLKNCVTVFQCEAAPALCSEICVRAPKGLPVPDSAGILEVDTFLRSREARRRAGMW